MDDHECAACGDDFPFLDDDGLCEHCAEAQEPTEKALDEPA